MTQVEIIALIVTFVGVISFATIITLLYHSYISSSIKDIKLGKQDADLIDEVIKDGSEQRKKRKKVMTIVKNSLFCVFLAIIIPVFALAIISKVNGEIGEVILNKINGRISEKDITIFDSTGLFIQDLATSVELLKEANNKKIGIEVEI